MTETNSFDPLSDVLHAVRLTGAVFFDFCATSPFAAEAPTSNKIAPHVVRGAEHAILEMLRRYLEALPPDRTGWLGALRDPVVGRAIALVHERPAHPWTVEEIARASGASRSALAERFTASVGMPPMQYLAQWRIQLAAGLLARSNAGIAAIAAEVGYESEAAFNRVFKKAVGLAPGTWRRSRAM